MYIPVVVIILCLAQFCLSIVEYLDSRKGRAECGRFYTVRGMLMRMFAERRQRRKEKAAIRRERISSVERGSAGLEK